MTVTNAISDVSNFKPAASANQNIISALVNLTITTGHSREVGRSINQTIGRNIVLLAIPKCIHDQQPTTGNKHLRRAAKDTANCSRSEKQLKN